MQKKNAKYNVRMIVGTKVSPKKSLCAIVWNVYFNKCFDL